MHAIVRTLLTAAFLVGLLLPLAPATTAGNVSCQEAVAYFRESLVESQGMGTPEVATGLRLSLAACPPVEDAAEEVLETLRNPLSAPCPAAAGTQEPHVTIRVTGYMEGVGPFSIPDDGPGYYAYDPGFRGYTQEFFAAGVKSTYSLLARDNHDAWIFVAGQPIEAPEGGYAEGGCIGSATPCWAKGIGRAVRTEFTIQVTGEFNRCG